MSWLSRWLGRLALHVDRPGGRWWSRVPLALLCTRLRYLWKRGPTSPWESTYAIRAVVQIMCSAQDQRASDLATRTVTDLSDDPWFLREILACFTGRTCALTATATSFLLAPLPATVSCPYVPRTRVVGFLAATQLPYPAPTGTDHRDVARWLVDAALETADEQARAPIADLLSTTDQPDLLEALAARFLAALEPSNHPDWPRLWIEGRPTALTAILQANPRLPRSLDDVEPGNYTAHQGVLLAIVKDRLDVVDDYVRVRGAYGTVAALINGTGLAAPETFTERCRQALRSLAPGPGQEELCRRAADGGAEARAAVLDAGFMWSAQPAAFLFLTEQWDRYDDVDPDGSLLREYCATHATNYSSGHRSRFEAIAKRTGRPDPCPPLPEVRLTSTPSTRRAYGSWPTNPGGGFSF